MRRWKTISKKLRNLEKNKESQRIYENLKSVFDELVKEQNHVRYFNLKLPLELEYSLYSEIKSALNYPKFPKISNVEKKGFSQLLVRARYIINENLSHNHE